MKISFALKLCSLCLMLVCAFFQAGSASACDMASAVAAGPAVAGLASSEVAAPSGAHGDDCCPGSADAMRCVACGVLARLPHVERPATGISDIMYANARIADFSGLKTRPDPRPPRQDV